MDYKETLQITKTDFPMRGKLPQQEPERQRQWEEANIYAQVQERTAGRPMFVLHDGPPYANGDIHVGHALNKVLKDMIVRSKSMSGYHAPYVPGWDTHGLPIEHAIIKNEKLDRKQFDIIEFRKMCAEYAHKYVDRQRGQFKRLGVRGDWDHPYLTLEPAYEAAQIRVFGKMAMKGYIYKGLKPVYWSPSSESALAEAEIEYHDKRSPSIYVSFQVKDGKGVLDADAAVIIWTTTPWTLPANLGICLHPDFDYVVVQTGGKKYVVAEGLLETLKGTLEWSDAQVLAKHKGANLEHIVTAHPLYDRESPLLLGDHVTLDSGTGCVHTAPGHGEDDFYIGQKYGLEPLSPIDDKGYFTDDAPGFAGVFYDEANKAVTEKLREKEALLKLDFITHSYPHDWRTKKPVIFRATEQWFASVDAIRDDLLEEIKKVQWIPDWGEIRLHNMMTDRGDWCISRQRVWGVPIPIFYCTSCQHALIEEHVIESVADIFEQQGSNAWFELAAENLLPADTKCSECGSRHFRKETDIMDVWFDSGTSHAGVLKKREELKWPASMYLEGSDQFRGWFNSSLVTALATEGSAPYETVLHHGFTLDGQGRKMSKSLGNTIDPLKVMEQLGADILRLWVASVEYTQDHRISDDILKQVSEVYRKIRNTLRFMLGNLEDFDPRQHRVQHDRFSELDLFMMLRGQQVLERVRKAYDKYQFHIVYHTIHNFCTVELSSFYLDISKDVLYTNARDAVARRRTQTVIYDLLKMLTQLLSPIIPHTADEVWEYIPHVQEKSVQLTDFPEFVANVVDEQLERKWKNVMAVREEVLKALEVARKNKVIGSSLEARVHLYPSRATREVLEQFEDWHALFIVSQVVIYEEGEQSPDNALSLEGLAVVVEPAEGEKCERCWMITPDRGAHPRHPSLCPRCADTVEKHFQHLLG